MMSPTEPKQETGFVLLEVMVALIVAALVLTPLIGLMTAGWNRQSQEMTLASAANWAQSLMVQQGASAPVFSPRSGDLPGGGHWDLLTTPYSDPEMSPHSAGGLRPYDVILLVSWTENGRPRHYRLETLRLASDNGNE